MKPLS